MRRISYALLVAALLVTVALDGIYLAREFKSMLNMLAQTIKVQPGQEIYRFNN